MKERFDRVAAMLFGKPVDELTSEGIDELLSRVQEVLDDMEEADE